MTRGLTAAPVVDRIGTARVLERGVWLYRPGSPSDRLHVLLDGVVKLVATTRTGEDLVVGFRTAGSVVGWSPGESGMPHVLGAVTCCLCSTREAVVRDLESTAEPEVAEWVRTAQQREIRELLDHLLVLRTPRPRQRILMLLARLGETRDAGEGRCMPPCITRYELAQAVGVSREHCSRVLAKMKREGAIADTKGRLATDCTWFRVNGFR